MGYTHMLLWQVMFIRIPPYLMQIFYCQFLDSSAHDKTSSFDALGITNSYSFGFCSGSLWRSISTRHSLAQLDVCCYYLLQWCWQRKLAQNLDESHQKQYLLSLMHKMMLKNSMIVIKFFKNLSRHLIKETWKSSFNFYSVKGYWVQF